VWCVVLGLFLLNFLKINIFTNLVSIQIFALVLLLCLSISTMTLVLPLVLIHLLVHFPETSFHLLGGPVNRKNEVKYQSEQQVEQECVE
jgi:hypothetical protein